MSRDDELSEERAGEGNDAPVSGRRPMRRPAAPLDQDRPPGALPLVTPPSRPTLAAWRAARQEAAPADPDAAQPGAARSAAAPSGPAPSERRGGLRHSARTPAHGPRPPSHATRLPTPDDGPVVLPPAPLPPRSALGRSAGTLFAGTFLSRISGFVRVIVAAAVLGVNGVGDAYNIANSIPNIVYDLLLGGVLSATLIPVFVDEFRREDGRERDRAVSAILTTAAGVLFVLTIALYVLAPLVIHLYLALNPTSGKSNELAIGISLLRLFSPQVFFLGAIVISTALLNARRQFAAAAFSPIVNNLIAIAALVATDLVAPHLGLAAFRHDHRGLFVLGLGTTLGYVLQFAVQIPAMARSGLRLRPVWAPRHPAVRRVVGLSAWLLGVVIANQISYNLIVVVTGKRRGDLTAYQSAYQFFQLPYALFAVSIASAIMPDLAERWAAQQLTAFMARLISGLRVTLAVLIPAAVGYAFVAAPVILLTYRHGLVTYAGAEEVAQTLAVFALGLPGFSAFLPMVRALQAMKDTRAMFAVYALENALTIVLALVLFKRFGDRGLAFAFVAPYTLAAIVTARYLRHKVGALGGIYTARSIVRTLMATAVMALVLFGLERVLPAGTDDAVLVLRLVVEAGGGAAVYVAMAAWLGIDDLQPVLQPARALLRRAGLLRAPTD